MFPLISERPWERQMSEAAVEELIVLSGFAAGLAVLGVVWMVVSRRRPARLVAAVLAAAVAVLVPVAAGMPIRSAAPNVQPTVPPADLGFRFDESPSLDVVATPDARTDRGRPIALLRSAIARPATELAWDEQRTLASLPVADQLIRSGPASLDCNAAGWVFARGQFWIEPAAVDQILADNGYQPVPQPKPGDLVVYRDGSAVVHVGVVRAADGPVLVESKWGWMGVFVHPAELAVLGSPSYLRSGREGHALHGLELTHSPAAPGQTVPSSDPLP